MNSGLRSKRLFFAQHQFKSTPIASEKLRTEQASKAVLPLKVQYLQAKGEPQ